MISNSELKDLKIENWKNISTNSKTLLLGNGFSLNFWDKLNYSSLFEFSKNKLSDEILDLFNEFDTQNFEELLSKLQTTRDVNRVLGLEKRKIDSLINSIKGIFINTIHEIHPKPENIDFEQIDKIGEVVSKYTNVFTTNYDLFLYYVIIRYSNEFSDHFYTSSVNGNFLEFSTPDTKKEKHVYYLHGSLFLFDDIWDTLKIRKTDSLPLIEVISNYINQEFSVLYVSEGNYKTKKKKIESNSYLKFCFDKLKEVGDNDIIVFGQSLSEQDDHLVEVLDDNFENVFISIKIFEKTSKNELRREVNRINSRFKKSNVLFFDSSTFFDFNL